MKKGILVTSIVLVVTLILVFAGCKAGPKDAAPAEFFKGKTMTIIVPFAAGGGNDVQARLFAPYLQKYTGAANVLVENMPGAGGVKGYNTLYTDTKPDGLTIGTLMGDNMALLQLTNQPGVQFDVAKYSWIGRWFSEEQFIGISAKLPYTTPKELAAMPALKMGTSAPTTLMALNAAIMANSFDMNNMKIVSGYTGTKEMALAVAQGEIQGFGTEFSVLDMYIKQGIIKLFIVMNKERAKVAPDVPTIYELAKQSGKPLSAEQVKWIEMGGAGSAIRRSLAAPPNTPKDRVDFLREAFWKAIQDKEWQAAWVKGGFPLEGPARGEELQKATEGIGKLSPDELKSFKFLLTEKYTK